MGIRHRNELSERQIFVDIVMKASKSWNGAHLNSALPEVCV